MRAVHTLHGVACPAWVSTGGRWQRCGERLQLTLAVHRYVAAIETELRCERGHTARQIADGVTTDAGGQLLPESEWYPLGPPSAEEWHEHLEEEHLDLEELRSVLYAEQEEMRRDEAALRAMEAHDV